MELNSITPSQEMEQLGWKLIDRMMEFDYRIIVTKNILILYNFLANGDFQLFSK
jgi:hypothetical protein